MSRGELSRAHDRAAPSGYTRVFVRPSLTFGRPTLADRFFERGLLSDLVLILAGAALTAILAHVVVPLWPDPLMVHTLGVLLVGGTLGATRATLSMLLYLGMAAAGLPVLAGGAAGLEHFTGPTAGYLYGFVIAAAFTGWMAQRSWDRRVTRVLTSFLAGSVLILILGVGWLWIASSQSIADAVYHGVIVLLPGTVLTAIIATVLIVLGWRVVDTEDRRRAAADLVGRE